MGLPALDLAALAPFWFVFSLLSAFFHASRLTVTKHLSFRFSARALTLYVNLAGLVVTLPLILWHHDFPLHQPVYVGAVLLGGLISGLGGWALNVGIHRSDVSLVGPVMTLTPGFVVLIEWVLIGDLPGLLGLLGLGLLMTGAYVLSIRREQTAFWAPLRRLVTDPGSAFTLVAAFCFAAAATLGRVGIQMSDPLSFAVMVAMVNPVILFLLFSLQDRRFYREAFTPRLRQEAGPLLLLGLLFALMRIADQIALSLTLASYAMAVKRSAGLFSVLLGRWVYGEGHLLARLAGSLVMLAGLVLLARG
ncbi:EamA family transporter [Thiohalocapsa marina]|uniref:EamA family transporter n=1 Tax=Thiohalocapsa marina TaxID=424902 RepID=UPI001FE4B3D7|nr:EamA family transporter [Thiohalocapsa marina]